MPLFSKEKNLAMFLTLDLSKAKYEYLRKSCLENGTNQWQSYYEIQKVKRDCYPPNDKIIITDISAVIELQAILDITAKKIIALCEDKLGPHKDLKLICKWGFNGTSNSNIYKQRCLSDVTSSDSSIFITSFIPIQLVSNL